jgi:hypothetical protein
MSLKNEKQRALITARAFLRDLLDPKVTPRIPKAVRQRAYWALRHYPADYDVLIREDAGGGFKLPKKRS